jgi:hypothetical protein
VWQGTSRERIRLDAFEYRGLSDALFWIRSNKPFTFDSFQRIMVPMGTVLRDGVVSRFSRTTDQFPFSVKKCDPSKPVMATLFPHTEFERGAIVERTAAGKATCRAARKGWREGRKTKGIPEFENSRKNKKREN